MWLLVNQTGELQNRLLTVILFTVTVIKKKKMEREGRGEGGEMSGGNESGRMMLIRSKQFVSLNTSFSLSCGIVNFLGVVV